MRLDKWQQDGIARMFNEGKSQRDIANAIGCTLVTVNKQIKKLTEEKKHRDKPSVEVINPPAETDYLKINLNELPTVESIKTDILIAYRRSLYEINERLPMMTNDQVCAVSMRLLQELNNGNTES